ncbi:hypothetical protein [Altererythrobacter sp. MF3-039]|uniref:hypothetical protein n=1 Tax=Altererythrobacter sp. MF3-039 TaxID=3252901 RepID=UPI00390CB2CE
MKSEYFRKLRILPALTVALVLSATALAQERVIPSDEANALDPPRAWDCTRIVPEYRAWLEAGNTPDTWRYVGPTYRDVADGTRYNWDDWLAWHDRACPAVVAADAAMPGNAALIGGVVGALGVTGLIAGSGGGGGGNDSPG